MQPYSFKTRTIVSQTASQLEPNSFLLIHPFYLLVFSFFSFRRKGRYHKGERGVKLFSLFKSFSRLPSSFRSLLSGRRKMLSLKLMCVIGLRDILPNFTHRAFVIQLPDERKIIGDSFWVDFGYSIGCFLICRDCFGFRWGVVSNIDAVFLLS